MPGRSLDVYVRARWRHLSRVPFRIESVFLLDTDLVQGARVLSTVAGPWGGEMTPPLRYGGVGRREAGPTPTPDLRRPNLTVTNPTNPHPLTTRTIDDHQDQDQDQDRQPSLCVPEPLEPIRSGSSMTTCVGATTTTTTTTLSNSTFTFAAAAPTTSRAGMASLPSTLGGFPRRVQVELVGRPRPSIPPVAAIVVEGGLCFLAPVLIMDSCAGAEIGRAHV